jgi:tetratricopeptide (TPR) repeat protein
MPSESQQSETAADSARLQSSSGSLPTWLLAVLLATVTLAAYFYSFQSDFVQYDDPLYITANPHIRTGLTWENARWAFSPTALDMGIWGPLTWLSHMTDCQLFGLNPAGHHTTSVLLHALNGVLLFLLLYKATGYRWRSLTVAALFALHPLNVENVAWIAERKSLLCMFFTLVAFGFYGWYARSPRPARYLAVVAAFTLALLAKPMAVTVPAVLLLLDYWPLQRITDDKHKLPAQLWQFVVEKIPLFVLSALFSWIAILSEQHAKAIGAVPSSLRLENAALSYLFYMRKMFWPTGLTYFYPFRAEALSLWHTVLVALALLAITAAALCLHRRRHVVFGWALYVVTLLPVIGIFQIGSFARADRYAYLPLIGLFIILVWSLAEVAAKLRISASLQAAVVIVVLALLGGCTALTAGNWRNDLTLFEHAHQVTSPPNVFNETNLAAALSDRGRDAEALVYYRNAVALSPNAFFTRYNLAFTYAKSGNDTAAIAEFHHALQNARSAEQKMRALNGLGIACLKSGDRRQALDALTQMLALQPDNAALKARVDSLRQSER